ncbi:MAG: hypothetical protein ACLFTS_02805 [Candidatus Paceibacterota bacterium]
MKYEVSIFVTGSIIYQEGKTEPIKITVPKFFVPGYVRKRNNRRFLKDLQESIGKEWVKKRRFFECILYDLCLDIVCYFDQMEFVCNFCPFWKEYEMSKALKILRSMPNLESRMKKAQEGAFQICPSEHLLEKTLLSTPSKKYFRQPVTTLI